MEIQLSSSQYMIEKAFPFSIIRCFHDHDNTPSIHGHDFIELVYIIRGEAQHCFEGDYYDIRSGDVFIINPGEVHTYFVQPGKQIEIINCLFLPELIQENLLRGLGISQSMDYFYVHPFLDKNERFHHRLNLNGQDAARTLSLLEGMIKELHDHHSGYSTVIRIQMLELLILLSRFYNQQRVNRIKKPNRGNENQLLIRRINGFLERHYDKKLSIPTLCELFNISSRQLNRVFKNETSVTVIERVHQIRIEKAKQYLIEGNDLIIDIANKVGYDDPAFFSRLFRRQVGCPPGKYRNHR